MKLGPGDSGAWIVQNGRLCGHIVAGRTGLCWGYMVPIKDIFDDISSHFNAFPVNLAPALVLTATPGGFDALVTSQPGARFVQDSDNIRIKSEHGQNLGRIEQKKEEKASKGKVPLQSRGHVLMLPSRERACTNNSAVTIQPISAHA
jgi:hypothetical protein